ATSRRWHLCRRAHRQIVFQADRLHRRPACTRPQAARGIPRAFRWRGHARGSARIESLAGSPRHSSAPPAFRRRQTAGAGSYRRGAGDPQGCQEREAVALRSPRAHRLPADARSAAAARRCARRSAGTPARPADRQSGPVDRAARFPRRWPRRGIHPIPLSRRRLRFRRRTFERTRMSALPAPDQTLMYKEARESAERVAAQLAANETLVSRLAHELREQPPQFIVTSARGSSDHAATFAKYVFETQLGLATSSASPSVSSVYAVPQRLDGALYLAI